MTARPPFPVTILTGFLGSGKTTLLNRLLSHPEVPAIAVVVNEIGAIGIDHLLVTEQRGNVALLQGGCLCCEVIDSLPETLLELCRARAAGEIPAFDQIVIETTGLADPRAILNLLRHSRLLSPFLRAGPVVTTVDALNGSVWLDSHPEAAAQVALSDRMVLTKTDLAADWSSLESRLRAINPLADLTRADAAIADPQRLLANGANSPVQPLTGSGATHSVGVASFSVRVDAAVTHTGLAVWAAAMASRHGDRLLRCKGIVVGQQGRILVQGVGRRFTFEPIAIDGLVPSALTIIGSGLSQAALDADLGLLHTPEGMSPPPFPQ